MWNTLKQVFPSKSIPNSTEITTDAFNDFFSSEGEQLTSNFNSIGLIKNFDDHCRNS